MFHHGYRSSYSIRPYRHSSTYAAIMVRLLAGLKLFLHQQNDY